MPPTGAASAGTADAVAPADAVPSPAEELRIQQRMELHLYDDPHSEYCAKVKVALHHKGLSWRTLPAKPCAADPAVGAGFFKKVPLGKIPALVVVWGPAGGDAGEEVKAAEAVLFESQVINEWLEDQFPQPPMLPEQPLQRSKARLISHFHDLYLEPAMRKLYPHVSPAARDPAAVAAASQEFYWRLSQLDAILEDGGCSGGGGSGGLGPRTSAGCGSRGGGGACYAVGNSLSLADCGYPALLLYAELLFPALGLGPLDYSGTPRVAAWREALWRDGSVRAVLRELEPAAQEWLDSKLVTGRGN